jgi:hypothetical protein
MPQTAPAILQTTPAMLQATGDMPPIAAPAAPPGYTTVSAPGSTHLPGGTYLPGTAPAVQSTTLRDTSMSAALHDSALSQWSSRYVTAPAAFHTAGNTTCTPPAMMPT